MTRRAVNAPTFWHLNPIPGAARVGPLVRSGFVPSLDPGSRSVPATFAAELANVFIHIEALVIEAGGCLDDVVEIHLMVAPGIDRADCNDAYVDRFPDEATRPALSIATGHTDFPLTTSVGATFTAYIID